MSTHRLLHWNVPIQNEFLDVDVQIDWKQVRINVENDNAEADDGQSRSVILEVRDNGALAVMCYRRDEDEPVVVILKSDGTYEVCDE